MEEIEKEQAPAGGTTNHVDDGAAEPFRGKIAPSPVESIHEEEKGEDLDDDWPRSRGEYGRGTAHFKRPSNKSDQVEVKAEVPSRNTQMKSLTQTLEQKVIKDVM